MRFREHQAKHLELGSVRTISAMFICISGRLQKTCMGAVQICTGGTDLKFSCPAVHLREEGFDSQLGSTTGIAEVSSGGIASLPGSEPGFAGLLITLQPHFGVAHHGSLPLILHHTCTTLYTTYHLCHACVLILQSAIGPCQSGLARQALPVRPCQLGLASQALASWAFASWALPRRTCQSGLASQAFQSGLACSADDISNSAAELSIMQSQRRVCEACLYTYLTRHHKEQLFGYDIALCSMA